MNPNPIALRMFVVAGDTPDVVINLTQPGAPLDVSDDAISVSFRTRGPVSTDPEDPLPALVETVCEKVPGYQPRENSPLNVADFAAPGSGGRVVARCDVTCFPDPGVYLGDIVITTDGAGGDRVATVYDRAEITVRAAV